jgi:nicotinamide-nucleotide amidase
MDAEIIAIGDELVCGHRLDTNSRWLSQRLNELGVRVLYHTTVGDDLDADVRVLREAIGRADIVVCTGGLGPTADDLTRELLANLAGVDLVLDDAILSEIRATFARRKRTMTERNSVQAMFPRGSRPIRNPHGTAPGIDMTVPRDGGDTVRVFALPGVPAEMREMWEASVAPAVRAADHDAENVIRHRCIRCFGVGESHLEQMLPDLTRRGREPPVGITASKATITLRITAAGKSDEDCQRTMAPTVATIRDRLGSLVFGEGDDELQHAVARILMTNGLTLATAEWGTGGLIAHWLADLPDAAAFYRGGMVSPCGHHELPAGADQPPDGGGDLTGTEQAMKRFAFWLREQFAADLGLAAAESSVTDGPEDTPPSFVMALASVDGVQTGSATSAAHPDLLRHLNAKRALDFVRLAVGSESVS